MRAHLRALGLNKQQNNMARLKVKQISDFTSSVQALIDNDSDQSASIIEQISEDLSNEIDATSGDVSSIDLEISTLESADVVLSNALSTEIDATSGDVSSIDLEISTSKSTDVVLSDALSVEIDATSGDVSSIDLVLGGVATGTTVGSLETRLSLEEDQNSTDHVTLSDALSTEIDATSGDVSSVDVRLSTGESTDVVHSNAISAEKSRIDAILDGATADLDQFTEVISYINSLESSDSLEAVGELASIDTRFSNLESTDVVLSNEISNEVSSIDVRLSSGDVRFSGAESTDVVLSNALSVEIDATSADVSSLDARASTSESTDVVLSNALSVEIDATSGDVSSIDLVLGGVATGTTVGSLETRLSLEEDQNSTDHVTLSDALSTEIDATSGDVSSIDVRFSGVDSTDVVLSNALSVEIDATSGDVSSIDVRFSGAESDITSLETSLDGFAKEAFIQAITSDIVGGSSATGQIEGPDGSLGFSGAVGSWTENGVGTVIFDLNDPIEGANAGEYQQNLVSLTINGLEVGHNFIRVTQPNQINVDFAGQFSGAATLEADDIIEFKYIKD